MALLTRIATWLRRRAENIIALLLASMFASFLIQIVFRYLLDLPLGWTVEYVAMSWLWGILFGYAFVVRIDDEIRLDIFYNAFPYPVRRVMDIIGGLFVAGVMIWSMPAAYGYVTFMAIERTAYMRVPFDWVFCIYLPFAVSIICRALYTVYRAIRGAAPRHEPLAESDEYA